MVESDRPLPWLRTVAFSVKRAPAAGALSLTVGVSTTRSGAGATPTATATADEQLLVVSDSSETASTHAVVVGAGRGVRLMSLSVRQDRKRSLWTVSGGDGRVGGLVVAQPGEPMTRCLGCAPWRSV